MSKWEATEFSRRIGKWELTAWRIDWANGPPFWLSVVRNTKSPERDVPIMDPKNYATPKKARIAAVKTYRKIKRRGL